MILKYIIKLIIWVIFTVVSFLFIADTNEPYVSSILHLAGLSTLQSLSLGIYFVFSYSYGMYKTLLSIDNLKEHLTS